MRVGVELEVYQSEPSLAVSAQPYTLIHTYAHTLAPTHPRPSFLPLLSPITAHATNKHPHPPHSYG